MKLLLLADKHVSKGWPGQESCISTGSVAAQAGLAFEKEANAARFWFRSLNYSLTGEPVSWAHPTHCRLPIAQLLCSSVGRRGS